jgi:RND family efflux transporter MFP subunit
MAALIALAGCSPAAPKPTVPQSLSVQAVTVAPPGAASPIIVSGTLRRRREMTLAFRMPGVMTRLLVDEGDTLKKGQLIASLDPTDVQARLVRATADLDRAQKDADRLKGLVDKGAISRQQYEAQETALVSARAARQSAAFDRRWADLIAPASGQVLSRSAQQGEILQPGQTVLTLSDDTSPMVVRVPVADADVMQISLGQAVRVRLSALPGQTLEARISRIGQLAGASTGSVEVEATLAANTALRSGLIAEVEIPRPVSKGSRFSRIPAEAVLEVSGEHGFVMAYDPVSKTARRTAIRFGGFEGDEALIEGVSPGARLITAGAGYVSDGQRVTVVDPAHPRGAAQ